MIELRIARPEELEQLRALFGLCFPDSPEFAARFFARHPRAEEHLVALEEGELRSTAALLDIALTEPDGRQVKAAYLYGVATHPGHRGKGFAGQLLRYADFYLHGKRDCLVTVPAGEALHAFYARYGFSESFPLWEGEASPRAPREGERSRAVDAGAYAALRERLLAGRYHVCCGDLTALQEDLCALSGGALLELDVGGIPGCAAVECWDGACLCKELLIAPEGLEGALALVAQTVQAPTLRRRRPAVWPLDGPERRGFGVLRGCGPSAAKRWQRAKAPYLGLAFD